MGSQSCKADSTNKIYRDYGQSIKEIRQTHRKTDMTSLQWRKFLLTKITEPPYSDIPNWNEFRIPIEEFINKKAFEKDLLWLENARFHAFCSSNDGLLNKKKLSKLSMHISHYNDSFSDENEAPPLQFSLDSAKLSALDANSCASTNFTSSSPKGLSQLTPLNADLVLFYDGSQDGLSPKEAKPQRSEPGGVIEAEKEQFPASEELKTFLRKQFTVRDHPVRDLIQVFKEAYKVMLYKSKNARNRERTPKEDLKKIENEYILPVKRMLQLLREFTLFIYKEVITRYHKELINEDQDENIIIDQLLCQLMFDSTNSLIYQHIIRCLNYRHKQQTDYFTQLSERFKGASLGELDREFKAKFMFLDSESPYETVIQTVHLLKKLSSPYMKRDYISTMEREMTDALRKDFLQKGKNLREIRLETDDKFTIYVYCLMRCGYSYIVSDIAFIEEFAIPSETNQAYVRFKGCLMDYVLSGDFARFMDMQEKEKKKEVFYKCD